MMTDPAGRRVLTELYAGQDWAADAEAEVERERTQKQAKQGWNAF